MCGSAETLAEATAAINYPFADKDGLKGFWRQVGTSRIYYPESNKSPIIHGFRMDFDTELLPSENTEFKALMSAHVPGWQVMEARRMRLT